jgi:opacity protein-like surface antigen
MKKRLLLSLLVATVVSLSPVRGADPFVVTVTSTEPNVQSLTEGYSSFPNLLDDVLNARGKFAPFVDTDFSASLSFLGISQAITASSNPEGTVVTLEIPGINFSRQFSGENRSDVDSQIKDFFLKQGTGVVGDFLNYVARHSAVAVTDGNPSSSTAIAANQSFLSNGFTPPDEIVAAAAGGAAAAQPNLSGLGIGFNSGQFTADGIRGNFSSFAIPFKLRFTDSVALSGTVPFDLLSVEGAKIYGVGFDLGLPIRIYAMDKENPTNWRVTPLVGISARGSKDVAGGGVIWMAGLNSAVDYRVNSKLIVCLVDQFTNHHGITVNYGDYKFDPSVEQQMLKNGVRLVTPLSSRTTGDVFVIETNYLKDAAVKNFTTFGVSLGYRITPKSNITLGANYDEGSSYRSWSVGLSSAWKF